jgi:dephospho-CoA kinase
MTMGHTAVIGLTGGIASGKSTVAKRFVTLGAALLDADQIARDIVTPGSVVLGNIQQVFGDAIVQTDGSLDRKKLSSIVFSQPEKLKLLNALTHPAIMTQVGTRLLELRRIGYPWVVYEAALIIENGLKPGLDCLTCVICEPETQLQRLMARNALDRQEAEARLNAQTDNETRIQTADIIIRNEHSLEQLEQRVDDVFSHLVERFGPIDLKDSIDR